MIEKNILTEQLLLSLESHFPLNKGSSFGFYPFANDSGHQPILENRMNGEIKKDRDDEIHVAILFGESNFISMVPFLRDIDLVILADINAELHAHTLYLLDKIRSSNSRNDFLEKYRNNSSNFSLEQSELLRQLNRQKSKFLSDEASGAESKENRHFMNSEENFLECKILIESKKITRICFNVLHRNSCKEIRKIFNEYNAKIRLVNITNIGTYDECGLPLSLRELINEENTDIIYSNSLLQASLSRGAINFLLSYYSLSPALKISDATNINMVIFIILYQFIKKELNIEVTKICLSNQELFTEITLPFICRHHNDLVNVFALLVTLKNKKLLNNEMLEQLAEINLDIIAKCLDLANADISESFESRAPLYNINIQTTTAQSRNEDLYKDKFSLLLRNFTNVFARRQINSDLKPISVSGLEEKSPFSSSSC